jgi:phage major head subunit gpT-like protein
VDYLFTQLGADFTLGMNTVQAQMILPKLATKLSSKSKKEFHSWMKQLPQMREWIGDRQLANLDVDALTVTNRKFESSLTIDREDFEDARDWVAFDGFRNVSRIMGGDAALAQDRILIDTLLGAATIGKWSDGDYYASVSRTFGTNPLLNYVTTAYDAAGAALSAAYSTITSYIGHNGKPLFIRPRYILHGPSLRVKVQQSLSQYGALLAANASTYVPFPNGNPNANLVEPLETSWLVNNYVDLKGNTWANAGTYWFILSEVVGGMRGLMFQDRIPPELQNARLDLQNSEYVWLTDKIAYGSRMRGEGFIALPQCVYMAAATS